MTTIRSPEIGAPPTIQIVAKRKQPAPSECWIVANAIARPEVTKKRKRS